MKPTVLVNCAISLDGRLAYAGGRRARLSGPEDLVRVQTLRASCQGILVGVGTVIADDPSLLVHWELLGTAPGSAPLRIVVDSRGRTPPGARVLDTAAPTAIAATEECRRQFPAHVEVIRTAGPEVDLPKLWEALADRGVRRVLVEGGASILASVLRGGLFDQLTVYVAPMLIGGATAPPLLALLGPECDGPDEALRLRRTGVEPLGDGVLLSFVPAHPL